MSALWRAAVGLAVLAGVVLALGPGRIGAALAGVRPGWVAVAVALLAGQIVLSALRWRRTARALGLVLGARAAVGEYFLAVLVNSVLPGGVLGDVGRAARARHLAGTRAAVASVVVERVAGQVALALAGLAGLALWLGPGHPAGLGALAGLGAVVAGFGLWLRPARPGGVQGMVRAAWVEGGAWRAQGALSLAILACNLGGMWAAAEAVGAGLPPVAAAALIPATLAAMLVPATVNGWGLREGAAAALWPLAGVAPEAAVAASLVFGLAATLAALPGLAVLWRPALRGAGA